MGLAAGGSALPPDRPGALAGRPAEAVGLRFFVGTDEPAHCRHLGRVCLSLSRLRRRKSDFAVGEWIMDSGGFTEIAQHGGYRHSVAQHAAELRRWGPLGQCRAAMGQDWMCAPACLARTGLTVADHQRLTIDRYDALLDEDVPVYVMPILQGMFPEDFARHADAYGGRLAPGAWVGVGSIQRMSSRPGEVQAVLDAIHRVRPDLRLHGLGLKLAALTNHRVRSLLHSADSMAWSYEARRQGRDNHDWREAAAYAARVEAAARQPAGWWQSSLALV